MKTLILAVIYYSVFSSVIYSQNRMASRPDFKDEYWKISFVAGGSLQLHETIDELSEGILGGYNGGFELSYNFEKEKTEAVISVLYSSFEKKIDQVSISCDNRKRSIQFFEISFGPKFYIGSTYFVQAAMGNYIHSYKMIIPQSHLGYVYNIYDVDVHAGFGFNIGGGKKVSISKSLDLNLTAKFHSSFARLQSIDYITLNAGLVMKNDVVNSENKYNITPFSLSVYGGIVQPEFFHSDRYQVSDFFGLDGGFSKSNNNEIFITMLLSHFRNTEDENYRKDDIVFETAAGPRYFIGIDKTRGFVEFGGGFYVYDSSNRESDIYLGTNAGVGLIHYVSSRLGVTLRTKMHILLGLNAPSPYLNAGAGVRWDI